MKHKSIKLSIYILFALLGMSLGELSSILGFTINTVSGNSMCPGYGGYGYDLRKTVTKTDDLEIGKVYIYEDWLNTTKYKLIEHRLVGTIYDKYISKGDNNMFAESVPFDKIRYKVLIHIPMERC